MKKEEPGTLKNTEEVLVYVSPTKPFYSDPGLKLENKTTELPKTLETVTKELKILLVNYCKPNGENKRKC